MATSEPSGAVRLSVLDRLLGAGSPAGGRASSSWDESIAAQKRAVLRDLEWLLNTRRTGDPVGDEFPELRRSAYRYGLADLSSMSADSPSVMRGLRREVEEVLEIFEPRLSGVRVSLVEADEERVQRIHFRVEGFLEMEPEPERIAFDTVLEIASGKVKVADQTNA